MLELNYVSSIKRFENKLRNNQASNQDMEEAIELLNQLWRYLNPYNEDQIEKSAIFDFLLLLMFNVILKVIYFNIRF